jgi:cob(I)alamin adenosyltransferase
MVKLNKIYTRTGDDGTTGLVDGSRVSKTASRLHAIGEVDETNSALGVAIQSLAADEGHSPLVIELRRIQNDLFDLGADIATPGESFVPSPMELRIVASQVEWLEVLKAGLYQARVAIYHRTLALNLTSFEIHVTLLTLL